MCRILVAIFLLALPASATVSYVGTLTDPNNDFEATFTLVAPGPVTIQTFGYGGGTNGNGTVIPVGGFDPEITVYTGTGATAVFLDFNDDGSCPPGTPKAGNCFDATLTFASLAAGTYTIAITAFGNEPFATQQPVFDTLGDGFVGLANFDDPADPTGNTPVTGDFAFDVSTAAPAPVAPEPATLVLLFLGAGILAFKKRIDIASRL